MTPIVLVVLVLAIYLLPAIVSGLRKHPQFYAITALNCLLGWTLLGWVIALVWALTAVESRIHDKAESAH